MITMNVVSFEQHMSPPYTKLSVNTIYSHLVSVQDLSTYLSLLIVVVLQCMTQLHTHLFSEQYNGNGDGDALVCKNVTIIHLTNF